MLVAFEGSLGSGKTLGAAMWAWSFTAKFECHCLSNVALRDEWFAYQRKARPDMWNHQLTKPGDFVDLARRGGGVILFDEIHQNLDSRAWASKNARYWTQFLMYLRKMNSPMFCTSQSVDHMLDVRVRKVLDLVISCRKTKGGFRYLLWDAKTGEHHGTRFIPYQVARLFYGFFNTKRIVRPVWFPTTERGYIDFLDALEAAVIEADTRPLPPVPDLFRMLAPGEVVAGDYETRPAVVSLSWD